MKRFIDNSSYEIAYHALLKDGFLESDAEKLIADIVQEQIVFTDIADRIHSIINEMTRTDLIFKDKDEKLSFLESARNILKDELFTCYYFLKQKGLLEDYHRYRDGD